MHFSVRRSQAAPLAGSNLLIDAVARFSEHGIAFAPFIAVRPKGAYRKALDYEQELAMEKSYVERRPTGFYLVESRVPLDCVVRGYWDGETPESIRQDYPTLTLEQVFGAIAFYLANKVEVDRVIGERERMEEAVATAHRVPAELKSKLERAHLAHGE